MLKNTFIILGSILIFYLILNFRVTITKNQNPSPKSKYLNSISITNTSNFTINNNSLIYLTTSNKSYEIITINLLTNQKSIKSRPQNDLSCTLKDIYIACHNSTNKYLYDHNFNLLSTTTLENNIIPYKDTYLKLTSKELLLPQKNKDIPFQTLNPSLNNKTYTDYYKTSSNTYLLFQDETNSYLTNINSKDYYQIEYPNVEKYETGFYFYNNSSLTLYNLDNNDIKEYSYTIKEPIHTLNNTTIFEFNNEISILYLTSLANLTTKELSLPNITVQSLKVSNNYLYLLTSDTIHIIDLTKITPLLTASLGSEDKSLITSLNSLTNTYNINIHIKDEASLNFPDFTAQIENNTTTINTALTKIEPILSKFNKEFFTNFYDYNYQGLNIYLTSTLTPLDYTTQVANPAAYSLISDNKYMIVIDITENNIEEIICHELMHNLEFNLEINNFEAFSYWEYLNPLNFYYNNSYTKNYEFNYTLQEENPNNVYFVDNYSHTYPEEDRARIFEAVCTNTNITSYPNLIKKQEYLQKEILTYYPELETTNLF